ncbi:MAG: winged helix-turn-helix domain-containing protein [Planctomycetota bacterium]|nr:winged helix-turn-helix domain-containing protein [Planctomycetota bacterium]
MTGINAFTIKTMDTQKVNPAQVLETLKADYVLTQEEIVKMEDVLKGLRGRLDYIKKLLGIDVLATAYDGMTIAEIAVKVLLEIGKPMSAMDISRRAMANGWQAENIERARSQISAVISKDLNTTKPRFWQVDRGAIGLIEWKNTAERTDLKTVNDAQNIEDDDIPF